MHETLEISEILKKLRSDQFRLIGIDGTHGVGKSTLARQITSELCYNHINLDDYLEKNRGYFVKHIQYDLVRIKIENTTAPTIIEGVCLLAVLEQLKMTPDLLIYIKRISHNGLWRDEDKYDLSESIDGCIAKEKALLQKFIEIIARNEGKAVGPKDYALPELVEEIIRYHHNFKPHRKANIIYKRIV